MGAEKFNNKYATIFINGEEFKGIQKFEIADIGVEDQEIVDRIEEFESNIIGRYLSKYKGNPNDIINQQGIKQEINNYLKEMISIGLFNEKLSFEVKGIGNVVNICPLFNNREILINERCSNVKETLTYLTKLNEENVIYIDELAQLEHIVIESYLMDKE